MHGDAAADAARDASLALFGSGDLAALDEGALAAAVAELPTTGGAPGEPVAQVLHRAGLTSSLGDSRRAIAQGGVYVNNERVVDGSAALGPLLHGRYAVLRRGRRALAAVVAPPAED